MRDPKIALAACYTLAKQVFQDCPHASKDDASETSRNQLFYRRPCGMLPVFVWPLLEAAQTPR